MKLNPKSVLSTVLALSLLLTACNTTQITEQSGDLITDSELPDQTQSSFCTDTVTPNVHLPAGDVLKLAKTDEKDGGAEAYEFTESKDAEIIPVDNDMSYMVWWEPEGFDVTTDTVVVSLGGHGGWAVKDFEVWYPVVSERNMAYLSLQWWFGRSLENEGYYEPDQIYRLIAEQLKEKGVPAGHVIFQGYSMGGARSYGVSLYDKTCGNNYFGVNIANSGPWENDYPIYAQILSGAYGDKPFENTHWILFCGATDINEYSKTPELANVCDGMKATQSTLTQFGATVDLFIKDPQGDHGSFMINTDNVNEGMDEAEKLLKNLKNN